VKFSIPEEHEEKVKHWAIKKMGEQFWTHKKNIYDAFKKHGKVPNFDNFPKYRDHWDELIRYRQSKDTLARSSINKASAEKKEYHHPLCPGGYKARVEE